MSLHTDSIQAETIQALVVERGDLRLAARTTADLLADAQHALEHGRYEVVAEYLERSVRNLRRAAK